MSTTKEDLRTAEVLAGKRVLVVEDDAGVAKNIANLLQDLTRVPVKIAHSMLEARELFVIEGGFDLALVDDILPETESDYGKLLNEEKILTKTRAAIKAGGDLGEVRNCRAQALRRTEDLVNPIGGVELVKRLRGVYGYFPVVFMFSSSRSEEVKFQKGIRGQTFMKPVPNQLIVNECVRAIKYK